MDVESMLTRRFPSLHVTIQPQMPPPEQMMLAQLLQLVFFFMLICQFAGSFILPTAVNDWLVNNRMMAVVITMACNMIAGKLIATGAFELTYGQDKIFSAIEMGRLPSFQEMEHELAVNYRLTA
eukprot:JP437812.1.p1 GENE.JP437812.1~~JP437812.1.p1  ORF type:complete len:124 (-),score=24.01 JP437812.1:59-430(-)